MRKPVVENKYGLKFSDIHHFVVLKPDELPDGWGLLEVGEHQIREIKEATHKPANKRAEVKMLMSAIRRLEISTAVFVREEHNR